MSADDSIQDISISKHFGGLDFDIADLSTDTTHWLVHHDAAVRQTVTLSVGAAHQQNRGTTTRLAHAISCHRTGQHLHRVVDGECRGHAAARRIDVEMDVFATIFALQIQQLHDDIVCVRIVDLTLEKHDAILEQEVAERQLSLTLIALIRVTVGNLVSHGFVSQWEIHAVSFERDDGHLRRFSSVEGFSVRDWPENDKGREAERGARRQKPGKNAETWLFIPTQFSWFFPGS